MQQQTNPPSRERLRRTGGTKVDMSFHDNQIFKARGQVRTHRLIRKMWRARCLAMWMSERLTIGHRKMFLKFGGELQEVVKELMNEVTDPEWGIKGKESRAEAQRRRVKKK